jgi:signal transduction histidine kinase/ActR/RegA family two-component response regulator
MMVALSVVVLVAASVVVALINEAQHRRELQQAAQVQARILAQTVPAALAFSFEDPSTLRAYIGAMTADPRLEGVAVYDDHGRRVAGFGPDIPERLEDVADPRTTPGIDALEAVMAKGVRLGAVLLHYRPEPLGQRLSRYIAPAILVLMALIMFAVMGLDARALRRSNRELTREMAEREKAEAALRQSQKMEAVGRLTGGVAHDFNNMLSIVMGSLDLLLRRLEGSPDPRLERLANNAMDGARRAANLTQRLLAFSRRQPLTPTSADIAHVLSDTADLLRRTLGEAIVVETVTAGGLWRAHIDVPQLESAIVNLGINARDAMAGGGRLTLEAGNTYLDRAYAASDDEITPGQYVMIAVTDTGAGMAPEVMGQVFEPFFTTKPAGQGTGLGLSQVHGFIKQSGGHIRLYSEAGVGTTVKLYLPRSMEEAAAPVASVQRSRGPRRRDVTVLVVEDEAGVREFVIEALGALGYDVLSADRAHDALALLGAHPEIQLMLTDVVMPGVNGKQLAAEAGRMRPSLHIVFMTGYTPNAIVHNGVLDPGVHLITKPFTVAQLGAELEGVLQAPADQISNRTP